MHSQKKNTVSMLNTSEIVKVREGLIKYERLETIQIIVIKSHYKSLQNLDSKVYELQEVPWLGLLVTRKGENERPDLLRFSKV